MDRATDVCFFRERCNSNPMHFTSGLESEPDSPPDSPPVYVPLKRLEVPPTERKPSSPKPNKRTRKMSLFSFHFNSKQEKSHSEDKHEKSEPKPTRTRRISTPSRISPMPYEDRASKFSFSSFHGSLTGSTTSSVNNSRESSPPLSRKSSERTYSNGVERENNSIRDIIFETLKLQFEGVTTYDREICDRLGKNVSQLVKRRVEVMKESLGLQCKIVTVVYVAAVRDKGIEVVSQCLLDADKDNFTAASFRNGHIFVIGAVMTAQCL